MKLQTIVNLYNAISELRGGKLQDIGLLSIKSSYALAKTFKKLEPIIEGVSAMEKPSEKYIEFQNKRLALCQQLAKKNKDGEPTIVNDRYVFDDQKAFDIEVEKLTIEYKETIEEREKIQKELQDRLKNDEDEVEIHELTLDVLPDPCPLRIVEGLFPMIKED